jgi:hypothetical protein
VRLAAHRLAVDTPPGWDARIYRRRPDEPEERTHPVVHAANFALPPSHGDFGSSAVPHMGAGNVLVVLVEYDAESARTPLFANARMPRPRAADFHPAKLQRVLPGQSGGQWFFHLGNRAFCLYVVLGSHTRRARLVPEVHRLLDRLTIEAG